MEAPKCEPGIHLGAELGGHCTVCGGRIDDANRRWLGLLIRGVSAVTMLLLLGAMIWWFLR